MQDTQDILTELASQEARLRLDSFDHNRGIEIGLAIYRAAQQRNAAVAIDVSAYGQVIFHLAMAGTVPDNDRWIERKRAAVLRFGKSSFRLGRELEAKGVSLEERYYVDAREYADHGGCFPLRLTSSEGIIGTVTVSGLPQEEDHKLVVEVLQQFAGTVPS